jgi:hypothetical protein
MSITFSTNADVSDLPTHEDSCICASYKADDACFAFWKGERTPEIRAQLAEAARPECQICNGTGVQLVREYDDLNMSNTNAFTFLRFLGLEADYCGSMGLPEARRAIMKARSRSEVSRYTRQDVTFFGAPRAKDDGTVELRPLRGVSFGLNESDLQMRLTAFAGMVERGAEKGATEVYWG